MVYNRVVNKVLEKVCESLSAYGGAKLALGVSGGRDSMCMLDAVLRCGVTDRQNITVVHVNHCLRDNADSDEAFVRKHCENVGIVFRSFRVDVKQRCADAGGTVEQAARELRYGAFGDVLKSGEADYILTAHHALDNAESVLMHIFRGTGLDGLRGIRDYSGSKILRPLIGVYPAELDDYAREFGIDHVEDETNFSDDADRNFLRLNVIPLIQERYRGAVRAINELAGECTAVCEFLDSRLDGSLIGYDRGAVTVSDAALSGPLAPRYVRAALEYFSTVDVTRDGIMRAVGLKDMRTGAVIELNNGVKAAREYGCIALYLPRPEYSGEIPLELGPNFIDGLAVDVEPVPAFTPGGTAQYADREKLDGAVIRFRRDGDMFTPFGGGRKKLKQYFIDKKIPKRLRERIPLVCKGDEVLVVVGVQVSDMVKIADSTKTCLAISIRR